MPIQVQPGDHDARFAARPEAIKRVISEFMVKGWTNHSPAGVYLKHVMDHCHENNIPYALHYFPGSGYTITRTTPLQPSLSFDKEQP